MPDEIIKVSAYSGYRGEECPRLFMIRGETIEVTAILSMSIGEQIENKKRKRIFQVRGSDGHEYKIYYDEGMKEWYLAKE
jgi:VIT1/CCC1 family predicted Fe2+/Mn2+ transporter